MRSSGAVEANVREEDSFWEELLAAVPRLKTRKNLSPSIKAFLSKVDRIEKTANR